MKQKIKKIITYIITWEAQQVLRKFKPKIIAVTGNVGKTSTKDAIFCALKPYGHVRSSEKSFNSDTGVPLSILGLPNGWNNPFTWASNIFHGLMIILFAKSYPEYLVLEVGADHPGDISDVAKWLQPDVSVFTRFPDVPVHIEFFGNLEEVIREKQSLAEFTKEDGILILNADDNRVMQTLELFPHKSYTYSTKPGADLLIGKTTLHYEKHIPTGSETPISLGDIQNTLLLPYVVGRGHAIASAIGVLIVHALGFDTTKSVEALKEYHTPPGRLSLIPGIKESIIIDDTYNASPAAMAHALEVLSGLKVKGRKIAVLGDMLELGEHTKTAHEEIGLLAKKVTDVLITVGSRAEFMYKAALEKGFKKENIFCVYSAEEALSLVEKILEPRDVILVKASQGIRLERVVKGIMLHPEHASKLLVRQDKEWQKR